MKRIFNHISSLGDVHKKSSSSAIWRAMMMCMCLIWGVTAAWAEPDDVKLTVTVHAGSHGTVAVSNRNNSTLDGGFGGEKAVKIYSYSRYTYNHSVKWGDLSERRQGTFETEDRVNYAYIAAKPSNGYAFVGWADKANTDPRTEPASTNITRKNHNTFTEHYRAWKFENVSQGDWNGIVKYVVTNSITWADHSDTKHLYAYFAKENKVTFNANGGSVTPESITVITGNTYGTLPTPTRAGYEFAGWFTSRTGGTKVESTTKYTESTNKTLYAHWTSTSVNITFVDAQTDPAQPQTIGTVSYTTGAALPTLNNTPYKLSKENKYFAGYYTSKDGKGKQVYKGISTNGTSLDLSRDAASVEITEATTLYAYYTHTHHVVNWDYTYDNGENWVNLPQDANAETRIKYGKLEFMEANGNLIKEVILTAPAVTNVASPTKDIHTIASGDIKLFVGNETDVLSGENIKVYFNDDQLSKFARYNFTPMVPGDPEDPTDYYAAEHWITTINKDNHNTVFTFTGAEGENIFDLEWKVTLTDLQQYPEVIYVKPTYKSEENWLAISQVDATIGVPCVRDNAPVADETAVTYSGSYPVWKKDGSGTEYQYSIGMTAFKMQGTTYYMDPEHGTIHSDMHAEHVAGNISTYTHQIEIKRTLTRQQNPTIRFEAGEGAVLGPTTPHFVVDENRTGEIDLFGYYAVRPGYTFEGWECYIEGVKQPETYSLTDKFPVGTKGVSTLKAILKDGIDPVITPTSYTEVDDHTVKLGINVTDNESGTLTAKYITVESETQPDPETQDYTEATTITLDAAGNGTITLTDPLSKVWVCIQAIDAANNKGYAVSTEITVDRQAPVIVANPALAKVCGQDVVLTITDNVAVTEVQVNLVIKQLVDNKLTLEKPATGSKMYYIWATDKVGNATRDTVEIFADHNWIERVKSDPTATMMGSIVDYKYCSNCGSFAFDDGTVMTPEEVAANIIPAGSVLVKDDNGNTQAWAETLNDAIAKVTGETGNDIKLTKDTNVSNGQIAAPTAGSTATIDLNGYGLLVDSKAGNITGNANVTILLKDNGATEYNNLSKVTGTPVKYVRDFNTDTRAGNWQALYIPFAATVTDYKIGQPTDINNAEGYARLIMELGITEVAANTSYFISSTDGTIVIEKASTNLLGYEAPENKVLGDAYTIKGGLKNTDNVSQADRDFWVLTNGGSLAQVKGNQSQRPYHWAIYANPGSTREMILSFFTPTEATMVAEEAKTVIDGPIYNALGVRMPANANLPKGLYISNGKKFYVK